MLKQDRMWSIDAIANSQVLKVKEEISSVVSLKIFLHIELSLVLDLVLEMETKGHFWVGISIDAIASKMKKRTYTFVVIGLAIMSFYILTPAKI